MKLRRKSWIVCKSSLFRTFRLRRSGSSSHYAGFSRCDSFRSRYSSSGGRGACR